MIAVKERLIFWPLLVVFIVISIFGIFSQGNKKVATQELLSEIEMATKKSKAKKQKPKDKWDVDTVKAVDTIDGYNALLKRSPFFRIRPEEAVKKAEPIPIKEAPKKTILKYKGRMMMGSKVMVIIENQGTGKSHFVKEGDMVADFQVLSITETQVVLKKSGGSEVVLSAVKKEEKGAVKDEIK